MSHLVVAWRARTRLPGAGKSAWSTSAAITRVASLAGALLLLAVGTSPYAHQGATRPPLARGGDASHAAFSTLPASLRAPVSRALGTSPGEAYRMTVSGGGVAASNPAQRLRLGFDRAGVSVGAGATHVRLSLRAIGYGASLHALAQPPLPHAHANTVLYHRGSLSEWYVNGPLGLEQGFTIARPDSAHSTGPLTLALTLSGNAHASLAGAGTIALGGGGRPSLRYTGLSAADSSGRTLRTWIELSGSELLLRVDTGGARYPLRIDPFVQQKEKLLGGGERGEGKFGVSVAMSADGNTALIGGPENEAPPFEREGEVTEQQKIVKNLTSTTGIFPGTEVTGTKIPAFDRVEKVISSKEVELSQAVEGEGAAKLKEKLTFLTSGIGAAWVFTRTGSTWSQQAELVEPTEEIGQARFGEDVSLSPDGNTALIGGSGDNKGAGAAWVFTRSGSTWTQQAKLTGGKEEVTSEAHPGGFGTSVALGGGAAGNTALIGVPGDKEELGAVWVFTRAAGKWSQQGVKLTGAGESGAGRFGDSVAVGGPEGPEGTTAVIGAPEDKGSEGAAWIFRRNSKPEWVKQTETKLTGTVESGTPGQFGLNVALESQEGNTALIGAASSRRIAAELEGEVTEKSAIVKGLASTKGISAGFEVKGAKVKPSTLVRQVKNETELELNEAIEGTGSTTTKETLTFAEKNAGAAWVFTRSSEKWTQQAKLVATGEIGEGLFGEGLALAANGNTALLGAPGNNGDLGTAWVFTRSGSTWAQSEQLLPSEVEGKAQFGVNTALSSTATTALVGGFGDNFDTGAAWVFTTGPTPAVETGAASSVTRTTATLNATVNPNGSEVLDCKFEYGPTTHYGSSVPCKALPGSGTEPVAVSATASTLVADTTYHFRISATDSGTAKGADHTFATLPNPPTVETEGISNLTSNSATLHGSVNPNATGNPAPLECKLEWGLTTAYGHSAPCAPNPSPEGTQPVRVTAQATGLLVHTEYHFRIWAKNAGGESAGSDLAFTTAALPPTAATEAASPVAQTSATAHGMINPEGAEVSECVFEYGLTTSYGQSVPCTPPPGSGTTPEAVSAVLESLAENTTYDFRVKATNSLGTVFGANQTFTTTLVLGPHWYRNGARLAESAKLRLLQWGTLMLNNATTGLVRCKTVSGLEGENPTGGGAAKSRVLGAIAYECVAPTCETAGGKAELVPEKLPWSSVLIEESSLVRDKLEGIALRAICAADEGSVQFHGSLAPEFTNGVLIGAAPSTLLFNAGSGTLQSTAGSAEASGKWKLQGYEAQELAQVGNP